jgi:hypothetical protein
MTTRERVEQSLRGPCRDTYARRRVMELHRKTGMGVLACRDAVCSGDEMEYLRGVYRGQIEAEFGSLTAVTWRYPEGLA